jgi:hypothetical protein
VVDEAMKIKVLWFLEGLLVKLQRVRLLRRWAYRKFWVVMQKRADLELLERILVYFDDCHKSVDDIRRDELISYLGTALLWRDIDVELIRKLRGEK